MNTERGRPRSFDKQAALDLAVPVFWRCGFQAAALSELTAAMDLNKPSLYAAFGDKEKLYLQALERYSTVRMPEHAAILERELDAWTAVAGFMRSLAGMYCDPQLPGGCLILNGVLECGPYTPPAVAHALQQALQYCELLLVNRLVRAQREGQLSKQARPKELASYFVCVLAGLSVLAKGGAKRAVLDKTIAVAMAAWPAGK
jgi:TetR/AcrR family transcriptional regulator, copper-responsive repressor